LPTVQRLKFEPTHTSTPEGEENKNQVKFKETKSKGKEDRGNRDWEEKNTGSYESFPNWRGERITKTDEETGSYIEEIPRPRAPAEDMFVISLLRTGADDDVTNNNRR
jgi:hypothetical protein